MHRVSREESEGIEGAGEGGEGRWGVERSVRTSWKSAVGSKGYGYTSLYISPSGVSG